MITVKHLSGEEWLVTVGGRTQTEHRVKVTAADVLRFAPGTEVGDLLKASFDFLLERERNTSILSSFALPVICDYFSEYELEIKYRAKRTG